MDEPDSLGGFQVDHELEGAWLLNRQIGWIGPLENVVDQAGGAAVDALWRLSLQSEILERQAEAALRQLFDTVQASGARSVLEWSGLPPDVMARMVDGAIAADAAGAFRD